MKRFLKMMGYYALACIGMMGVGSALGSNSDSLADAGPGKLIFINSVTLIFAISMMIPFFKNLKALMDEWKEQTGDAYYISTLKSKVKEGFSYIGTDLYKLGHVVESDLGEQESLIRAFRESYHDFFMDKREGIRENTPLQSLVGQIYYGVLSLQKKRLDRAGIRMGLMSKRMRYGSDKESVAGQVIFDGRYEVSDVSEMILAERAFYRKGKKLKGFHSKEAARYQILNAEKTGRGDIICPSCGKPASRENLIDGCDYCGSSFLLEDLSMKISSFMLYPDISVAYARLKEAKMKFMLAVSLPFGFLVFCQTLPFLISQASQTWGQEHFLFDLGAFFFMLGLRPVFLSLLLVLFLNVTLFPFLQARLMIMNHEKKSLDRLKRYEEENRKTEERIREKDPLFSMGEFYSNLLLKLSVLHFSEEEKQMQGFTEGKEILKGLPALAKNYEDVLHLDMEMLRLDSFSHEGNLSKVTATCDLVLMKKKGNSVKKERERVRMEVVKKKDCLTKSVCEPRVVKCKKCGASHNLLDGRCCSYCGHERVLSNYDWAIRSYELLK